jgi:putative transposase
MPWEEICVLDARKEFTRRALTEKITFTELCNEYGISTKTGYKWKNRFLSHGYHGLSDQSRSPKNSPSQLAEDAIIRIIKLKLAHPTWGPKKILQLYEGAYPFEKTPCLSSIGRVLDKAGLVEKRRSRRVQPEQDSFRRLYKAEAPNDVWTVDFKGWWFTTTNEKCLPLTIRDEYSRYIFEAQLMVKADTQSVREVFTRQFMMNGLPSMIKSDNGPPFAAPNGSLGLTKLSAWWMSLGILPTRIEPGKPYQNGSHERMHRDIAFDIQRRIQGDLRETQAALDLWREEYNTVRPHEAIGMSTPVSRYQKSEKGYSGDIDEIIYPANFISRRVSANGTIGLDGIRIYINHALIGYPLGLQADDDNRLNLWFSEFLLGSVSLESYSFEPLRLD